MARTKPIPRVIQTRSARAETRSRAAKRKGHTSTAALLSTSRTPKARSRPSTLRKKPVKKKQPKTKLYAVGKKVRVWWPPTRNKKRTDFSGAYWPAKVVESFDGGYRVEYDNQEREDVDSEDVSPAAPPVSFGEETTPLAEKEFCEVFNESETDPSAWLAQITSRDEENYTINFPFHDSEPEVVPARRIRRARVFDELSRSWKVIKPGQEWEDGEISSPYELELIDEATLPSAIASLPAIAEDDKSCNKTTSVQSEGRKSKDMGSIMNGLQAQKTSTTTASTTNQTVKKSSSSQRKGKGTRTRMRRKKDEVKDPNAPKKPRSAYVFFMENERKLLKERNPSMRPQHIMKLVGENWAKLKAEEKEQYWDLARIDRQRYVDDMNKYIPPEASTDEPGAKRAKVEDLPRKPMTAFLFFSKELRQKLGPELTAAEKSKKIAEAWREMPEEEKNPYQRAALEDKARYEREVEELATEVTERDPEKEPAIRSFVEVAPIDFQPPPLTRQAAPALDEESKKILEQFDLNKVREEILEVFVEKAYYTLLDVWREGSHRVGDAIRAYKTHIDGHDRPHWKSFFTSVVGVESTQSLLKASAALSLQPEDPPTDAPASMPASSSAIV